MKYQAVIFDLDGVICSTDHYHYLAWKRLADEIGIPFDEKVNNRLRGVSRMASLDIILEAYNGVMAEEDKRRYAEQKNAYYRKYLEGMSPQDVSADTKSALDIIKSKGIKEAIGSSSKNAKFILEQIGLKDYFDAVSDGTNITRSKPDPEVFLKAAEFLGISPRYCIVVEDAKAGIEAALSGGMDCAAIGDATQYNLATYNISRLSELIKFVI